MADIACDNFAPKYLTLPYLENILRQQNESVRIVEMMAKPSATVKGENYVSLMTRMSLTYETANNKELHKGDYIVKSQVNNDPMISKLFASYAVTATEMAMYDKVLPEVSHLLKEIGDEDELFTAALHVDYANQAIIFQDLSSLNYSIGDRLKGLNIYEAKIALRKLAKMHAAAAVLNEQKPQMMKDFAYGIVNDKTQGFASFFNYSIIEAAKCAATMKELGDYYYQKLMKLPPKVYEKAWRARKPTANRFNTLIHGDFWVNNIMIRRNNGISNTKLDDMLMIDFQFCCWAPATIDLHYFMNTSLEGGLHEGNEAILIQHYSEVLQETMTKLNYKGHIPTLHELWVQYEDTRFYGLTSALVNQPLMINPITDDADIHSLIEDNERAHSFRKTLYENPVIRNHIKRLLPLFDKHGLLEEHH